MHKNTFLFVTVLAIFAALVVGVNLGRKLMPQTKAPITTTIAPDPEITPTRVLTVYTNTMCGFSLNYPATLTLVDSETGNSAILNNTSDSSQSIAIACQKEIPRPAIAAASIETIKISGTNETSTVSAKLYHNSTAKDGTPIDELIFTNPKNGLDIFIAGYGDIYNEVVRSVTFSP